MIMDPNQEKKTLQAKLVRCHKLAREYTEGTTAKNLRELIAEIEQEIRALSQ